MELRCEMCGKRADTWVGTAKYRGKGVCINCLGELNTNLIKNKTRLGPISAAFGKSWLAFKKEWGEQQELAKN